MDPNAKPVAAPASVPATTRADAELWGYERLRKTGRDVANLGKGRLVISYAGRDPQRIMITCRSGKAAKRTQMVLRRQLRIALDDAEYNRLVDAFFEAIRRVRESPTAGDLV